MLKLQVESGDNKVLCDCGDVAVKEVVKKEGKNKGRVFFHCGKLKAFQCKFWQWKPEETEKINGANEVKCKCGEAAKREVVKKEGKNRGRVFYHCGKAKADNCKFWQWGKKEEWVNLDDAEENDEKKAIKRMLQDKEAEDTDIKVSKLVKA